MEEKVFFICSACKKPGFEIPKYIQTNVLLHPGCQYSSQLPVNKSEFKVEKNETLTANAYITFDEAKKVIFLTHPYSEKLNSSYRRFFKFTWNPDKKRREIKVKDLTKQICDFLLDEIKVVQPQYKWQIDKEVINTLQTYSPNKLNKFEAPEEIKLDMNFDPSAFLRVSPFQYQKEGIAFLEAVGGVAMIADSMGLGKTLQAIAYTAKNDLKTIVICPASLKYNWKKEVEKFTNRTALVLEPGTKDIIENADYIIVNYEQLVKWEAILTKIKFQCVILDESHYIANVSAKRTKQVFKLFKNIPKKILLSGTPIKNRPIELYSQLKFLKPKLFPRKQDFGMRYCDPQPGFNGYMNFNGSSNEEELRQIMSAFTIRRLKENVLTDLPPKMISNIIYGLEGDTLKEYRKLTQQKVEWFSEDNESSLSTKKNNLMEVMRFCSREKVPYIVDFVQNIITQNDGQKIVIFAHFKETQELLKKAFENISASIVAEDSAETRQKEIDKFQTNKDIKVFIGSLKAAGTGITLTAADTVLFADILWTPSDHKQAEDRIHRISQTKNCFIYYSIFKDSVEEIIWNTLKSKLEVISKTLGDDLKEEEIVSKIIEDFIKNNK